MENMRKRLMGDPNLYPELAPHRPQAGASSMPPRPPSKPMRSTVIISSDEEDNDARKPEVHEISSDSESVVEIAPSKFAGAKKQDPPKVAAPSTPLRPSILNQPRVDDTFFNFRNPPTPIAKPMNPPTFLPQAPPPPYNPYVERYGQPIVPGQGFTYTPPDYMSSEDTEKALRELMGGGMNQDLDDVEIDPSDTVVDGFKDGIELLPHQVLGRAWMRDRESGKLTGGILADDMGLGKTIQTLTRIVEGRAKKSDKADGWSASSLVICPLALVGQWADEISKMCTNIRVLKHQGTTRTTDAVALQKYHVVVTTYDTVKSEYVAFNPEAKDESTTKASSKKKRTVDESDDDSDESVHSRPAAKKGKGKAAAKKCALFGVKWFRIVLDEAHNIKNVKTKGAIACCALESKFRWCLTGTPMQNNVTELYSLIKFLRIKPLNDWETFNDKIAKPVKSGQGASRAMKRLQVVLKTIMLRRRKTDQLNGKSLIELPKRTVDVVACPFDESERTFYNALETKMESVIEKLMKQSSKNGGSNYMSVLLLLLRLRQACNHPILVSADYKKDSEALEPKAVEKGKDDQAPDADDDLIAAFGQLGVTKKCKMCTAELSSTTCGEGEWSTHCRDCVPLAIKARQAELERPTSAKIRMVLKLLREIDERSDTQEKTIIFSQFTSMLDLLEPFLRDDGIKYVRYDGSMNPREREASLEKIKTSSTTRVILISFKAGSTGLNLTACNNVILVDLWWNPALEDQAFDRAHRFGQKRDVNIYKLKIDDTVEDRILELQDKKRILAAAALSGDKIKNMRLGMDDLLALFRHGRDNDDDSD